MTVFVEHDGGRAQAGYRGDAGDCVVRAITIATRPPLIGFGPHYLRVYETLSRRMADRGHPRSARNGILPSVYRQYLADAGWAWTPTMSIGSGCKVHLAADELPSGRLIVRLSRHITAVIDGAVYDTYDPSRGGTRCVYGYWRPGE